MNTQDERFAAHKEHINCAIDDLLPQLADGADSLQVLVELHRLIRDHVADVGRRVREVLPLLKDGFVWPPGSGEHRRAAGLLAAMAAAHPPSTREVLDILSREAAAAPHRQDHTRKAIARVLALPATLDDPELARASAEQLRLDPRALADTLRHEALSEPRNRWLAETIVDILEEEARNGTPTAIAALGAAVRDRATLSARLWRLLRLRR
jgi:hypothetical protein